MACANTIICNRDSQEVCTRIVITVAIFCTCHIAKLYRCRCDAEPVCARGQVDTQPTADSADNFTPWTRNLGHTCVNFILLSAFYLNTSISLCLLGPRSQAIEGGHVGQLSRSDHAWSETEVLTIVEAQAGPFWKSDRIPFFAPIFCHCTFLRCFILTQPCVTPVHREG